MDNYINTEQLVYDFFCNLKTGDEIGFYNSENKIKINGYKPLKSFTLEYTSKYKEIASVVKIRVVYAYGNWYTGLKSKGRSKPQSILSTIWRNIEGEMLLNLLNANNPFHEQTQIFKIAKNKTI